MEFDRTSLAAVAPQYGVSRERIRQIVKRTDMRLWGYFKWLALSDHEELFALIKQLSAVIAAVDYDLVGLAAYGMLSVGKRKKQMIFHTLFGQELGQKIITK